MVSNLIQSQQAPEPVGSYPHARAVGNLLFLSGIGPRKKGDSNIPGVSLDSDNNIIHYDIVEQTHSVMNNVKAVLESAGANFHQLLDITVFLTNMKQDFPLFNETYSQYFIDHQPCRTTVEVTALPTPIAVEFKCIAVLN